jgi:hypothetical protein
MSKRTDYLNGDNSGTDAKLDRIAELEGGQLINRNAIARKDARITELEAALRGLQSSAQSKPHHAGETPREYHMHAAICEALKALKETS